MSNTEKVKSEEDNLTAKQNKKRFTLVFYFKKDPYNVTCDQSMTLLEALQAKDFFKTEMDKKKDHKILIQRRDKNSDVTPGFPCCLIGADGVLDISFEPGGGENTMWETTRPDCPLTPENLLCFYIGKSGNKGICKVIEDSKFIKTPHACVYAFKGESIKAALERDGRFTNAVFEKGALSEVPNKRITSLSDCVDELDGKTFQVSISIWLSDTKQEHKPVKDEKKEAAVSSSLGNQTANPNQKETNSDANEKKTKNPARREIPKTREIPNTGEILKLLRDQFGDLLKKLKERENLKNASVRKCLQVEFSKHADFWDVKKMKKLMELSNCVCQIRIENVPYGTGFLLFDRFILTNAHVVKPEWEKKNVTAVFDYEELGIGEKVPVKERVASSYGQNEMGNHLDFALLELERNPDARFGSGLLACWENPPIRGKICVIGHPEDAVKRMDSCVVIPKGEENEAAKQHLAENQEYIQVIMKENLHWNITEEQITYHSCFFYGSSGSPVFDEHCNLIGIHTGGYVYPGEKGKTNSVMEYALPMFPILVSIYMQCKEKRSDIEEHFQTANMEMVIQTANKRLNPNVGESMDVITDA